MATNITIEINETAATFTHPNGTTEQVVVTITPSGRAVIWGVWLDLVNLTQNCTIRAQYRIDGTNYRTFQTVNWTTGMEDGVLLDGPVPISQLYRVSIQSTVAEGANRSVPYRISHQGIEHGLFSWTYTLTRSDSGAPIANAQVWVTSDASGNSVVASGVTNASGQVTFLLEQGSTVYVFRSASGYVFTDPDTEVVA